MYKAFELCLRSQTHPICYLCQIEAAVGEYFEVVANSPFRSSSLILNSSAGIPFAHGHARSHDLNLQVP
jgi:hypothetical protein